MAELSDNLVYCHGRLHEPLKILGPSLHSIQFLYPGRYQHIVDRVLFFLGNAFNLASGAARNRLTGLTPIRAI